MNLCVRSKLGKGKQFKMQVTIGWSGTKCKRYQGSVKGSVKVK